MPAPTLAKSLNLSVSNFGPIIEANIDLRPLTVFVGPGNAGKSYMATLICALHGFFSIPARLDIPKRARKDMANWLARAAQVNAPKPLPKSVESLILQSLDISASRRHALMEEMRRCFGKDNLGQLTRYGSGKKARIAIKSSVGEAAAASLEYEMAIAEIGGSEFRSSTPKAIPAKIAARAALSCARNSGRTQSANDAATDCDDAEYRALRLLATAVSDEFIAPLNSPAHFISAGRSIMRTTTGLTLHNNGRRSHDNSAIQKAADRIEKTMLGGGVQFEKSATGCPEFRYRPNGWKKALPLTSASSTVSELAPVVLYLRHVVSLGDTLIIEEPESHLHPAMQVEFIRQLAAVALAGVRVILTTHSEWVLDELSNLTLLSQLEESRREGIPGADFAIDPKSVGVWLFRPKKRPKGSAVEEIPFCDEYGRYSEDYTDVVFDSYNSHAEIFNRIQGAKGE